MSTILDQAEQRAEATRAQTRTAQTQVIEEMRDEIGRQHYQGAKNRRPQIAHAIQTRFLPALARVSATAQKANVPLPAGLREPCDKLNTLCHTVLQQIDTGIQGFESLSYRDIMQPDGQSVHLGLRSDLVGGTRSFLISSDGMLAHMNSELAKIESYISESGWPSGPREASIAPEQPRPSAGIVVETDFKL